MYSTGKVMPLIGQQYLNKILSKESLEGLHEIQNAHTKKQISTEPDPLPYSFDTLIDAFAFGFINGKREERSRRKVDGNPERYYQRAAAEAINDLSPDEARLVLAVVCGLKGNRRKGHTDGYRAKQK